MPWKRLLVARVCSSHDEQVHKINNFGTLRPNWWPQRDSNPCLDHVAGVEEHDDGHGQLELRGDRPAAARHQRGCAGQPAERDHEDAGEEDA